MKHYPYGKHHITEEDIEAVKQALQADFITQGPRSRKFEEALAEKVNARFAVTFSSGTAALHAAYFALDIKAGSEFITTPMTFAATANAGLYIGLKPVFCDIDPETGNMDPGSLESLINERTRFIVPVHYAGHPADLEALSGIAKKHDLLMVEDACHAPGAKYKDHKIGAGQFSELCMFSFHPVKHIAAGEGGAVTTNEEKYYKRLIQFRNHGITREDFVYPSEGAWYYEMQFLGYNYRMTEFQAALAHSQLGNLDGNVERRREIAAYYNRAFKDQEWFYTPVERDWAYSSYHLYPIRLKEKWVPSKKEIFDRMLETGLGVQTHYIPVYRHPYYRENGYKETRCEKAEAFYRSEISIPMYPALTDEDLEEIINRIRKVFSDHQDHGV